MRLMDRRSALEAEMDGIIAALSAPGGAGITGSLVDAEGFPRADIDIPAVLAQRRKLGDFGEAVETKAIPAKRYGTTPAHD
uniref:Nas2 N-terminal domain-containing protein n=1 Tax=Aegilops tauschii TaxID=37682 RepID=R7W692_AEGTA